MKPPLVAHIIHRLAVGGLENGLINLINGTDSRRYRHAIISLTDSTEFRDRIRQSNVPVVAIHKQPGKDIPAYQRLWRVLKEMTPAIVHTRNLPALECLAVAALAGVGGRVHGEHGRDIYDLDGASRKYKLLRRAVNPFVSCYTAVSRDLAAWLVGQIGISQSKVIRICNGVDAARFIPRPSARLPIGPQGFVQSDSFIVGTVGRMQAVKDQLTLVRAFLHILQSYPDARREMRLVMIGDGPLRDDARKTLQAANAADLAWLPGERSDIPELMRSLDLFVLPSIAEGISNTILEAMACGLPVVATRVGGNSELVQEGITGVLVPPSNPSAMAEAIHSYLMQPGKVVAHGNAARDRVEKEFSLDLMIDRYLAVYDSVLTRQG